jgi:hypothetical protein
MTDPRTIRNLDALEQMPRALRECVHEFGSPIVNGLMQCGVIDPARIRLIVHTCWMGARQPNQRIGGTKNLRNQSPVVDQLDWLLIQSGCGVSAATLLRVLWMNGMVIVPYQPSPSMIEASMATVSTFDQAVTKHEKHRQRLRAAIEAGARRLWPSLYRESDTKKAERARVDQVPA